MTTELTLRKISKLVSKIDNRIHETSRDVNKDVIATVVIHDTIEDMVEKIDKTHTDYTEGIDTLLQLVGLRVTLRSALGAANQNAGINHLVTELRGLEQKLSIVTQLIRVAPEETQLSEDVLRRRMTARQDTVKNTTIDVSGYSRFSGAESDTVRLPVFTAADVLQLELLEKKLADQIETTHDKLEQLNASVAIELPDDVVGELQELDIIK